MITWGNTTLGKVTSGSNVKIAFGANAERYELLNGVLPAGITLSESAGTLSGTAPMVSTETVYAFTIRAFSGDVFSDMGFSLAVGATKTLAFSKSGLILTTVDSVFIDMALPIYNPANVGFELQLVAGQLPPGLYIENNSLKGYCDKPFSELTQTYAAKTFTFTLALDSVLGRVIGKFQVKVNVNKNRKPVLLNLRPEVGYEYDHYSHLYNNADLGRFVSGDEVVFKLVGKDFDKRDIEYVVSGDLGSLDINTSTGWVTGKIIIPQSTARKFSFSVYVRCKSAPSIKSTSYKFWFTVSNNVSDPIVWGKARQFNMVTEEVSNVKLMASSELDLAYTIVSGDLPPNISLTSDGMLVGRIPSQPKPTLSTPKTVHQYMFTVTATSILYPALSSSCDFQINVTQLNSVPVDTAYIKLMPAYAERVELRDVNAAINAQRWLYRPSDSGFKSGVSRCNLLFGLSAGHFDVYHSILQNFEKFNIDLGELKRAVATVDGETLYEVVYFELNSTTELSALQNTITQTVKQNRSSHYLPLWMRSQQESGDILGPVNALVVAFVVAGRGQEAFDFIQATCEDTIRNITFTCDRLFIDKTTSLGYNTRLSNPQWQALPSKVGTDTTDFFVMLAQTS